MVVTFINRKEHNFNPKLTSTPARPQTTQATQQKKAPPPQKAKTLSKAFLIQNQNPNKEISTRSTIPENDYTNTKKKTP